MSEYFRELRKRCQKVDNDTEKLVKMWESPHLLMGGYGENVEEASPYLEHFLCELKQLQDHLIEDRESRMKHITSTEKNISSVEIFYKDLKQQCDDVESMLSDYGYKPLQDDSVCLATDESEAESSILTASQMDHSRSPCLDYPDKSETDAFCTPTINVNQPKSIATPVIMSLSSAMKMIQTHGTNITSSLSHPQKEYHTPLYGRGMN